MSLSLTATCLYKCVSLLLSALCFYKCSCSIWVWTAICWNSHLITKSFLRQLVETKRVLRFDLIYEEQRSIIIWQRIVEEEASREEGTDFSKGKNDMQKTTERRPHFISSVQMWLKYRRARLNKQFAPLLLNTAKKKWSTVVGHTFKDNASGIKK